MPSTIIRCTAISAPSFEPLTLAEAKAHLRIDTEAEDDYIGALIIAARQYTEVRTGRSLCAKNYRIELAGFPPNGNDIVLPMPPVQEITQMIYFTSDGTETELVEEDGDFRTSLSMIPARIKKPFDNVDWANTAIADDAVVIEMNAGYLTAEAVPATAKHAMRLLIGNWFENREAVITGTIQARLELSVDSLLSVLWIGEMGQ